MIKIVKQQEGTRMKVALTGRLDTLTAPELEKALKESYDKLSELILDLASLEYVSSAGLRVLLGAHKQMQKQQGELVILNVNEVVMEVFEVTGFADIFTIR